MRACPRFSLPLAITTSAIALALSACGGTPPADKAGAAAQGSPAPTVAQNETATPPVAEKPAAVAAPAPAQTQPARPAAKPAPKPAAEHQPPPPIPRPAPVIKTLAAGTDLDVELLDAASSKTSQVGDALRARVTKAVVVDGLTAIPAGTIVDGTITEAIPLKAIGGAASLGIKFETLELPSGGVPIAALIHQQGKSETGKDAGTIAGATVGGALLGRLLSHHDKTKGTLIGAAVGAAAGTGAAAATKGQEVELPAGTPLAIHLEQPVSVTIQP